MPTGLHFYDLDVTADIDGLLGAAEEGVGSGKGKKFTYSKDSTLAADSNAVIPTQHAVKSYVDSAIVTENLWDKSGTTLSPHTSGDGIDVTSTVVATPSTGAIRTEGGISSDKNIYINDTTDASSSAGSIYTKGGLTTDKKMYINDTAEATSTAGSVITLGGISSAKAIYTANGLKDSNVTTAIKIGDGSNASFSTSNKTIVGSSNELRSQKNWNHSGLISGGTLSINADTTKFDVAAGSGKIMDLTDPANPIETIVTWTTQTALTTPYLATLSGSWVGYRVSSAAIITSATDFTVSDLHNDVIRLGRLSHFGNTVITGVYQLPLFFYADLEYLCLGNLFGVTNLQGNDITANGANLKINKDQGMSFRTGAYVTVDPNNPNYPITSNVSQVSFLPAYRSATAGRSTLSAATTDLDPEYYDDGTGTLHAVTAGNYTIKTALFFPANGTYTMFMLYGQGEYATFTDAMSALTTYSPEIRPDIAGGNIRAFILIQKGTTDLAAEVAAGTAYISGGSLFGTFSGGGGGGGGSFTPDHNSLGGLQGGTASEYYHITNTEHGYISGVNAQSLLTTSSPTFNHLTLSVASIAAAGTTQGTATPITTSIALITSGTATQGVILPSGVPAGTTILVNAYGLANSVLVYPHSGGNIDSLGAGTNTTLPANQSLAFTLNTGGTNWVTTADTIFPGIGISIAHGSGGLITITNVGVTNLSGTANQITASSSTGNITVSLPSNLILPNGTTATTQAASDNSTKVATTAYIDSTDSLVVHKAGTETVTGDKTLSGTITMSSLTASQLLALNAGKSIVNITALPNLTTATTQAASDNSTKVATTAYVDSAVLAENLWDRAGTTLSPHTSGDGIDVTSTAVANSTTAAIKTEGGICAVKNVYINDTTDAAAGSGSIYTAGGISSAKKIYAGDTITAAKDISIITYNPIKGDGGNSYYYLQGQYTAFGDGVSLMYNMYADPSTGVITYPVNFYSTRVHVGYDYFAVYCSNAYGTLPIPVFSISRGTGFAVEVYNNLLVDSTTDASAGAGAIYTAGGLSTAKKVYVGTALNLPSPSGGTRTDLTQYEVNTLSMTFTSAAGTGGATVTVNFEIIGHKVFMYIPNIAITGNNTSTGTITTATAVPSRFRPGATTYCPVTCQTGTDGAFLMGNVQITLAGVVTIYYGPGNLTPFPICPITKNFGIHDSTITWHVA